MQKFTHEYNYSTQLRQEQTGGNMTYSKKPTLSLWRLVLVFSAFMLMRVPVSAAAPAQESDGT
jgi:hypothetical protein